MELNKSNVVFDPIEHTYLLNDKSLSGVTSLLERQLGSKYIGISDEVLQRAVERGKDIHSRIELYDEMGIEVDDEYYNAYKQLIQSKGLVRCANEYLVSDNDHVASSIDIVFEDCSLADIKTTSKIDYEYVSWQLSIYAYLFSLQNSNLTANKLYVIWLPKEQYGKPAIMEVQKHSTDEVKAMIECDKRGENYFANNSKSLVITNDIVNNIVNLQHLLQSLKDKERQMRAEILKLMQENDIKQFKNEDLTLTRKLSSVSERLDTSKLKAEFPEIYSKCLKQVITEETLMIKI